MENNQIKIEFEQNQDSFTLIYKNKVILKHTQESPCIQLAHLKRDFRMNKRVVAYYKLHYTISDVISLNEIQATQEENKIKLIFNKLITLSFREEENRLIIEPFRMENANKTEEKYDLFILNLPAYKDEAIYGCGEQFSYLNLKGRKVPLWTQEPGMSKHPSLSKYIADWAVGAGGEWWTTYIPHPTYLSSQNYFVHVQTYAFAEFNFTAPHTTKLMVNEIPSKIVIDVQPTALSLLDSLTMYLGRQRPLPSWIMDGVVLGIGGGMDENDPDSLVSKLKYAQEGKVKVAAIWAEDWSGIREFKMQTRLYWNWMFSPEMYPDLPNYIQRLREEGIRFLGYNNCFLMEEGPLYEYAKKHDLLVKKKNGEIYRLNNYSFYSVLLDLTNPKTWEWFKSVIKEHMIAAGLDGWMCDFAEYLPIDAEVHTEKDPYLHHNEYPVLWAKINAEAVQEAGRDKGENAVVFFSRSGNYDSNKYSPLFWAGDQMMRFWLDMGLAAQINAGISMGLLGMSQTHADVAGEIRILWLKRTKEFFMRGTEYCAFTPVMRTHDAKGKSGWKFSRIHSRLVPYFRRAIQEYTETGVPIMRHPYLHYEADPTFHLKKPRLIQYQYLLGRDLFIAPVYLKKKTNRKLYLPKDEWVHLWSGKEYKGGWITVNAPLWEPPVFYRKNSDFKELFLKVKDA